MGIVIAVVAASVVLVVAVVAAASGKIVMFVAYWCHCSDWYDVDD